MTGPVDTTLLVAPGIFGQCLELAGADPGVDAVLALTTASAGLNLVPEVPAARLPVPIAAAVMEQVEVVRPLRAGRASPAVPAYAYSESAARALGHAARYGVWRAIPPRKRARPRRPAPGPGQGTGRRVSRPAPRGGRLAAAGFPPWSCSPAMGIPLADSIGVVTEDGAAAAAERFGAPGRAPGGCTRPGTCRRGARALLIAAARRG